MVANYVFVAVSASEIEVCLLRSCSISFEIIEQRVSTQLNFSCGPMISSALGQSRHFLPRTAWQVFI
jgi:hypothetical protein